MERDTGRTRQAFFWCLFLIEFKGSKVAEMRGLVPNDALGPGTRFQNLVRGVRKAPIRRYRLL